MSGYSYMMAVSAAYQNQGIGARLKWAQRARALSEGRDLIRWTWEPMRSRNAHFNLNRLGVVIRDYAVNFYGTDYVTNPVEKIPGLHGMNSDRLFASWELRSPRAAALAAGLDYPLPEPDAMIEFSPDFSVLLNADLEVAKSKPKRRRGEFLNPLAAGFVFPAFYRSTD